MTTIHLFRTLALYHRIAIRLRRLPRIHDGLIIFAEWRSPSQNTKGGRK